MTVEQTNITAQIDFRQRCRQVAGTATVDTVGRELAVNFIDRVSGQ
jgi:hypothetical protein